MINDWILFDAVEECHKFDKVRQLRQIMQHCTLKRLKTSKISCEL
jgi:hypothetical protein